MGKRGSRTSSGIAPSPSFRVFHDSDEIQAWAGRAWEEWLKGLDKQEAKALRDYTRNEYEFINGMLRGQMFTSNDPDIYVDPVFRETAQRLDEALARAVVAENVTVYRGMRSARVYQMIKDGTLPIGARMTDKAYVSTSFSESTARSFANVVLPDMPHGEHRIVVTIDVPTGSAGGYVQSLSRGSAEPEHELLLPRECRFLVKGYEIVDDQDWPGSPPIAYLRLEVLRASTHEVKSPLYPPDWVDDDGGEWGDL